MRLAFCLYKYFPHGGLARDMLRIAHEAVKRGHQVDLYCREWQGSYPKGMPVFVLPVPALSNHGRALGFARRLTGRLHNSSYDAVVGFNKLPGLNFYFAADGCYAAKTRRRYHRLYELTPRYRSWRRLEKSVFGTGSKTKILLLSEQSHLDYRAFYATADERVRLLPPTLDVAHRLDALTVDRRVDIRTSFGADDDEALLMMVGSGFHTKGVDRTLRALAALPDPMRRKTRLVVVGRGEIDYYQRLANSIGIGPHVVFTRGRDDVPELLRAADVLVHPARQETAGTVLLEALAAGLPVLTTANCGYAHHVDNAEAGLVLHTPFRQQALNEALRDFLAPASGERRKTMAVNAKRYGQDSDLYRMPEAAVDLFETWRDDAPHLEFTGYVHPDLAGLSQRLPRLEDWVGLEGGEVFRRTADRKTVRFEHDGRGYFLKAHFGVGWREILKNLVHLKLPVLGAGNEWLAIHFLESLGVPTMTAVAYGEEAGWAKRQSFIVTRELEGMTSLEDVAERRHRRGRDENRKRRRLIQKVALIARMLHGNGINHRDFYLCHFLLDPADGDDDFELHLIDLHRAQIRNRTPRRWRIKDISGLYYSALGASLTRQERLRFVQAYDETGSLRRALGDRSFWSWVERRAHELKRLELSRGYADTSGVAKPVN